ncbi:MAG: hypothetical protein IJ036_02745 [Lachnospiraceae bacterium]|nr:hypothetical protein [Lachnospiraceae bacterium]
MLTFDLIQSGLIVLALMAAGELLAHRLRGIVPAILASSVLYIGLLWSGILPADLIQTSGLTHLAMIGMMFTIIGMGTSLKLDELLENWRVVALAAISFVGQLAILLLIINALFGRSMAFGAIPGGAAVALIVQEQARALGYDQIVVLSVLLLAVQGLVACPLASLLLRKEVKHLRRTGALVPAAKAQAKASATVAASKEESPYWALLRLFATAWLASRLEILTGISKYVMALFLGILLTRLKFLHQDETDRTKSRGFLMLMMMTQILDGFSGATPAMFQDLLIPLAVILLTDILSIGLVSILAGKLLGFTWQMSFAIGLNVMIGFPLNLMLAQDIIEFLVKDPSEREALSHQISTKMVLGGFTSVTFLSTIAAGFLVKFM